MYRWYRLFQIQFGRCDQQSHNLDLFIGDMKSSLNWKHSFKIRMCLFEDYVRYCTSYNRLIECFRSHIR